MFKNMFKKDAEAAPAKALNSVDVGAATIIYKLNDGSERQGYTFTGSAWNNNGVLEVEMTGQQAAAQELLLMRAGFFMIQVGSSEFIATSAVKSASLHMSARVVSSPVSAKKA